MEFTCVVCSKPADVYCHNDNAYLCAACDVTVHSAHALAASHVRTPVQCNVNYTDSVHPPVDAVSNQILAPEPVQEQKDEISFDADDWFAVPDVVSGDTKEVQSTSLRGKAGDDKLGFKRKEDSFDIDFSCVPWDIPLGADPLDLSFDLPLDVPSLDSDLVPSVPSSPGLELDGEVPVDPDPKEIKTVKAEVISESNPYDFSHPSELRSAHGKEHLDDSGPDVVFDAFQDTSDIPELNVDIPPPSVQESVKVVPAAVPVPLHAQTWIQTYVPHTLLPTDPATRAAALQDRRERVARFRAKKNNFHFKKTIRYASRKRYAEKRPRIKGRFARKDEIEAAIKAGVPLVA